MMVVDGFVIVGPFGITGLESGTFATTPRGAWLRHMQMKHGDPDEAIKRSRWAQKGWKPISAQMQFNDPDPK